MKVAVKLFPGRRVFLTNVHKESPSVKSVKVNADSLLLYELFGKKIIVIELLNYRGQEHFFFCILL